MIILSTEELAAYYEGDSLPGRAEWWETLIARALRRLEVKIPGITARVTTGAVDLGLVQDAVASAVLRAIRNPTGAAISSETSGPFSRSVSWQSWQAPTIRDEDLYFTDDEMAGLQPLAATSFEIVL